MENRDIHTESESPVREVNERESLSLILETIDILHRATELQELLSESMEAVCQVMRTEASSLMLLDEQQGVLKVSLPTGPVRDKIRGRTIPRNRGIGGWVVENRRPYLTNNPSATEEFWGELSDDFHTRNLLCVPLMDGDRVLGVLQAVNRLNEGTFQEADIPVFSALSLHVSQAIQRHRQIELLKSDLREQKLLIRESHHRIKNNLASISALIELELPEVENDNARQALKNTLSRLQSMTEVHDLVSSTGEFHQVDLGMYLDKLSRKILQLLSDSLREIEVKIVTESIRVSSEKAMYCGMILSELLVNVYKHAFREVKKGEVEIQLLREEGGIIQFRVTDNGSGIPEDFNPDGISDRDSVGVWVIDVLRKKLNATLDIRNDNGTCVTFGFPESDSD